MRTVEEAERIILENKADLGNEIVLFTEATGRVLAENIKADRDMPPFNRVAMDGIAVKYEAIEKGNTVFRKIAVQAAGDAPAEIKALDECIEIMTGAMLPESVDTVIPYEQIDLNEEGAVVLSSIVAKGQNIHTQGRDRKQGDILAVPGQVITPAVLSLITSVGEEEIRVKKLPRVVVVSTGDEVIDVRETPKPHQIRRSNNYTVQSILKDNGIHADILHLPDEADIMERQLAHCLQYYDAIILTGGVSAGKFDLLPEVLERLFVKQIFHKVAQRPGKPFWFGKHENGVLVFAFPGNPVAAFMCTHRYFLPWLRATLGMIEKPAMYAVLDNDVTFKPELVYFMQVKLLMNNKAQLIAEPVTGNGSGDFANLADADAFMELPADKSEFKKGEVYRIIMIHRFRFHR
ncbi:molybdopterin molybdenumtransferase MoeA [Mucilaginibacter limnophilus]|uniref:Molybdopterin molybdenumtransferase n=1 Tax=Mucilaginibacter limnophilus TaxID=1932778 RepID=A0A437MSM5_9SPHI|nr:molybdopterin molybdotransferase MoeA [Mucilaginibacter limnophilus]RVU00652.1 molybdopterin molybdenumtransferase MoeA [Mucilaginibacter limnophilus]